MLSVPIDTRDITVTPVFKHITVEDVPASEREGKLVMKTMEVVEVRFAGSKLYSPVFPVDAMWKRDGHRIVTYAERWSDQFQAFRDGTGQRAAGTPLEMLKNYGITDSQLSLCRALKVYSIEALHHLEGSALKSLGMAQNELKRMASAYLADQTSGKSAAAEIARLKEEIARLQNLPANDPKPAEIDAAVTEADAEFEKMSSDQLKAFLASKVGRKPAGNPSHETLVSMAREVA